MRYRFLRKRDQRGVIAILALMAVSIFGVVVITMVSLLAMSEIKNSSDSAATDRTFAAAESGINDALYRIVRNPTTTSYHILKNDPQNPLPGNDIDVSIVNHGFDRLVTSTATDQSGKVRKISLSVTTNTFAGGFEYALQSGAGGIILKNNDHITGNLYANGPIQGFNNDSITGNASSTVLIDSINSISGSAHTPMFTNSNATGGVYIGSVPAMPLAITLPDVTTWKDNIRNGFPTIKNPNLPGCPANTYCVKVAETFSANTVVNGDLQVDNPLTVQGNVWVKGKITGNGNIVVSTGSNASAVLIADNCDPTTGCDLVSNDTSNNTDYIELGGFVSSTNSNSFLILLTVSNYDAITCDAIPCSTYALDGGNQSTTLILAAIRGSLYLKNGGSFKAAAGNQIVIKNNLDVMFPSSGLSGMYVPATQAQTPPTTQYWREL